MEMITNFLANLGLVKVVTPWDMFQGYINMIVSSPELSAYFIAGTYAFSLFAFFAFDRLIKSNLSSKAWKGYCYSVDRRVNILRLVTIPFVTLKFQSLWLGSVLFKKQFNLYYETLSTKVEEEYARKKTTTEEVVVDSSKEENQQTAVGQ